MEDSSATMVSEIFAGLCAKELDRLEAQPPRLQGTWSEIGQLFRDVGAGDERCAVVESRRLEAVGRYFAIRARFAGKPPQFELEGWTDQARPRC